MSLQLRIVSSVPLRYPSFEQRYSGVVPYWLLLPLQIALIALLLRIVRDFAQGDGYFVDLKPHTDAALKMLSYIYFLSMVVRYIVTMAWHPELRWFTGTIPIWFHMDLAAFILNSSLSISGQIHTSNSPEEPMDERTSASASPVKALMNWTSGMA